MFVQPAARMIGILFFALAAGCVTVKEQAPPSMTAQTGSAVVNSSKDGSNQDGVVAAEPLQSEAREEATTVLAPSAAPHQPVMTSGKAIEVEPVADAATQPAKRQSAAKAAPLAKIPKKVSSSPAPIEQPRKVEDVPLVVKKPEPPLDVAALTTRLRDTKAIGMFTKLALKNQMDDLLKQFRAHYQGGQKTSVASLRQPYDMLILKVLTLVQDSDPSLARALSGSREAIWGILADPEKFNSIT